MADVDARRRRLRRRGDGDDVVEAHDDVGDGDDAHRAPEMSAPTPRVAVAVDSSSTTSLIATQNSSDAADRACR